MAAGDPIIRLLLLQTTAGAADSYADETAFTGAGWDLDFRDSDGITLSPQPDWTLSDEGDGLHAVYIEAEPSGPWFAKITVPAGHYSSGAALTGDGDPYSISGLAALLLSTIGTPVSPGSRVEGVLEDWVEGDYYNTEIIIPAAELEKISASDLTGVTVSAAAKQPFPTKTSADTEEITFTVTVIDAAERIVSINTPVGASVLAAGEDSRAYVLDVTIVKAGKKRTSNRYTFNQVWQADTR